MAEVQNHQLDKRIRYRQDDPMYYIYNHDVDLKGNEVFLTGVDRGYEIVEGTEEPGVDYVMASRFIRNMRTLMKHRGDEVPLLIHMMTCFPGRTPISTESGPKQIRNIKIGDRVLTHTGEYQPVIDTMSKFYTGEMVKLYYGRQKHSSTSITATSEHPILVERNGIKSWVPMSDIVAGDIIFVNQSLCEKTSERIPYWKRVKRFHAERLRGIGNNSPLVRKIEKPIIEFCDKLILDGWKAVPVDMGIRPDIVAFKDGKVTLFEIENLTGKSLEVKQEKYTNATITKYVDDIQWVTKPSNYFYTWYEADNEIPFIKVKVTGTKRWFNKVKQRVYNLTVAKDNSYVANNVVVHNCGGDWNFGMAIYDAIRAYPAKATILAYGHARSMSSVILQAATKRVLMPHCSFMLHMGTYGDYGTQKEVESNMEFYKKTTPRMLEIYAAKMKERGELSKHTLTYIKRWLKDRMNQKENVWLSAKQAVDYGLADEIFDYDWKKLTVF